MSSDSKYVEKPDVSQYQIDSFLLRVQSTPPNWVRNSFWAQASVQLGNQLLYPCRRFEELWFECVERSGPRSRTRCQIFLQDLNECKTDRIKVQTSFQDLNFDMLPLVEIKILLDIEVFLIDCFKFWNIFNVQCLGNMIWRCTVLNDYRNRPFYITLLKLWHTPSRCSDVLPVHWIRTKTTTRGCDVTWKGFIKMTQTSKLIRFFQR